MGSSSTMWTTRRPTTSAGALSDIASRSSRPTASSRWSRSPSGDFGDAADPFPRDAERAGLERHAAERAGIAGANTGVRIWNILAGEADSADSASFDLAFSTRPELHVTQLLLNDNTNQGYPDPGETIDLTVTLRNVGLASAPLRIADHVRPGDHDHDRGQHGPGDRGRSHRDDGHAVRARRLEQRDGAVQRDPHAQRSDGSASGSQPLLLPIGVTSEHGRISSRPRSGGPTGP